MCAYKLADHSVIPLQADVQCIQMLCDVSQKSDSSPNGCPFSAKKCSISLLIEKYRAGQAPTERPHNIVVNHISIFCMHIQEKLVVVQRFCGNEVDSFYYRFDNMSKIQTFRARNLLVNSAVDFYSIAPMLTRFLHISEANPLSLPAISPQ